MIFQQLEKSTDFELDFKLLKLIFFIGNRKSEFLKQIQQTQFIVNQQRRETFVFLQQMTTQM